MKKNYPIEFKKTIVKEAISKGNSAEVAKKHELNPNTVQFWVQQYKINKDSWEKAEADAKCVSFEQQDISRETLIALRKKNVALEKKIEKMENDYEIKIKMLERLIKKSDPCRQTLIEEVKYWDEQGYSVNKAVKNLGIPRSVYYYQKNRPEESNEKGVHAKGEKRGRKIPGYALNVDGEKVPDEELKEKISLLFSTDPNFDYGTRKLSYFFMDQFHISVNHKKMRRLLSELGLLQRRRKRNHLPLGHKSKGRTITGSNQLWEFDIQFLILPDGIRVYILSIIDVFDRVIVASKGYTSCRTDDVIDLMKEALSRFVEEGEKKPDLRSDHGTQFHNHKFRKFTVDNNLYHEFTPYGSPDFNAHIESYHSVCRISFLERHEFYNFQDFLVKHASFIKNYNENRLHGGLRHEGFRYDIPMRYRKKMKNVIDPELFVKVL